MVACSDPPSPARTTGHLGMMDDTLLKFNHGVVVAEGQDIDDFITRYHWKMNRTETGLRWMIYRKGNGGSVRKGDVAVIQFSVSRITGEPVYRSDSLKPFEFETGRARVPNGLEEGVMLMKTGDRAKLIVPSHLAFGLLGDMDKITSREILVYDIELCQVKPRKN
jgi:FKBP-type peptidyl-prolyl cis-trans isomerase